MLSLIFRASRKRDLLLESFFSTLRSESSPRSLVEAFTPILSEMTKFPKDKYFESALQSGFQLLHDRLPRNDFVMVALHVMGQTNQGEYNSPLARAIAFTHVQESFKDSLVVPASESVGHKTVGLIFAARSVVLSSLEAGNVAEARHIVSDLQSAIEACCHDNLGADDSLVQKRAQSSVLRQTVNELAPRLAVV